MGAACSRFARQARLRMICDYPRLGRDPQSRPPAQISEAIPRRFDCRARGKQPRRGKWGAKRAGALASGGRFPECRKVILSTIRMSPAMTWRGPAPSRNGHFGVQDAADFGIGLAVAPGIDQQRGASPSVRQP